MVKVLLGPDLLSGNHSKSGCLKSHLTDMYSITACIANMNRRGGQVISLFHSGGGVKGFFGFTNVDVDCYSCVQFLECADHAWGDPHFGQY